jgi:hypothetical protein
MNKLKRISRGMHIKFGVSNPEEKTPLWLEDNIRTDDKERGCEIMDWIHLSQWRDAEGTLNEVPGTANWNAYFGILPVNFISASMIHLWPLTYSFYCHRSEFRESSVKYKKINLSLYITKHHAMKTHALVSARDGDWSASRPGCFKPGEIASGTH